MATAAQIAAAATLTAAGFTHPSVIEQTFNYVLTSQGKDAAGNARTAKYVNLSPTYDVATQGAALVSSGIVAPSCLEQVGQLVLAP